MKTLEVKRLILDISLIKELCQKKELESWRNETKDQLPDSLTACLVPTSKCLMKRGIAYKDCLMPKKHQFSVHSGFKTCIYFYIYA